RDSDEGVRRRAAEALVKIGDAAVDPLTAALKDPDKDVRLGAVRALKALTYQPRDETQKALMFVANREWDNAVRLGAVAVDPLIAVLMDSDEDVRHRATEALGKIGDVR